VRDVTGPYRGGEAIDHVVGDLDRLVDCFEGDGRQFTGPEDLLAPIAMAGRTPSNTVGSMK